MNHPVFRKTLTICLIAALLAGAVLSVCTPQPTHATPLALPVAQPPSPSAALPAAPSADVGVTAVSPLANTHTASLTATLTITLSGAISETSVTTRTVVVHGGMHGHMDGAITFGSIQYDPDQDFFPGELVQTSVSAGVLDSSGVPITPTVWQFRAAAGVGPGGFIDSGQNLGDSYSQAVALGDVDGDGDLDAFVGNSGSNEVWLNAGGAQGGTPGTFIDSGQSLGHADSTSVALGDVDNDGDLDAFIGNHYMANTVWLNAGGLQGGTPGTFIDSGQSLGEADSMSVALGDLDGDGDLDAFVGNVYFTSKVWLNNGGMQGGTPGTFIDSGQSLGEADSMSVALGDVDGDGDLDAFLGNYYATNTVWLNAGGLQGGALGAFIDSGQNLGAADSWSVALGDIDGDGDLDAFVGNRGSSGEPNEVWLNDGGMQNGTPGIFIDSGQSLGDSRSHAVVLGDVDGDGDLDAFVGNGGYPGEPNKVWMNAGGVQGGTPGTFIYSEPNLREGRSHAVALGDVDGDGDLDAFVGNSGSNKVWMNAVKPIITGVTAVSPPANTHTASLTATLAITLSGPISETSATTQTIVVHGGMHGNMNGAITFDSIHYDPDQDFFPGELVQTSVTTGVLDSNGALIIPTIWQFRAAAGVGPGTFFNSGQNSGDFASHATTLGDLDGDGDLDAFVGNDGANKVWLNAGGVQGGTPGIFIDSGQSLGNANSYAIALGDVDGDGDLDAFVANTDSQPNTVWLNNGGAQGGTPGTFTDSGQLGTADSRSVALGDVDNDGDLDAFVGNWYEANKIWLNEGGIQGGTPGIFTDSGQSLGGAASWTVALGDVDGDGDLDAFVGNYAYTGQPNKVWLNDGGMQEGTLGIFTNSGQSLGNAWSISAALGDLDGDGDLDAFVGNYGEPNQVWLNDGMGVFTDSGQSLGSANSRAVALGDVDGDGDLDAFVGNSEGQPNKLWLNNGTGVFTDSGQILGSADSYAAALGDVDGDGDLDAFVGNWLQPNYVWLNETPSNEHKLYLPLIVR